MQKYSRLVAYQLIKWTKKRKITPHFIAESDKII